MALLSRVFVHAIGSFAAGSFHILYRKVQRWTWEVFGWVSDFVAWRVVPVLICWLTIQDYISILSEVDKRLFLGTYLVGLLWEPADLLLV